MLALYLLSWKCKDSLQKYLWKMFYQIPSFLKNKEDLIGFIWQFMSQSASSLATRRVPPKFPFFLNIYLAPALVNKSLPSHVARTKVPIREKISQCLSWCLNICFSVNKQKVNRPFREVPHVKLVSILTLLMLCWAVSLHTEKCAQRPEIAKRWHISQPHTMMSTMNV